MSTFFTVRIQETGKLSIFFVVRVQETGKFVNIVRNRSTIYRDILLSTLFAVRVQEAGKLSTFFAVRVQETEFVDNLRSTDTGEAPVVLF